MKKKDHPWNAPASEGALRDVSAALYIAVTGALGDDVRNKVNAALLEMVDDGQMDPLARTLMMSLVATTWARLPE